MKDCRKCKVYQRERCPGKTDWYAPSQIVYCYDQMKFLIENLQYISEGKWPMDTKIVMGGKTFSGSMPIIMAILADINMRLDKLPKLLKELLITQMQAGWYTLEGDVKLALIYISGSRAKKKNFTKWKAGRNYDKNR